MAGMSYWCVIPPEDRARWLIANLVIVGERPCGFDSRKRPYPVACFDGNEEDLRELESAALAHCDGSMEASPWSLGNVVRVNKTPGGPPLVERKCRKVIVGLGSMFAGSTALMGPSLTRSYAIDYDDGEKKVCEALVEAFPEMAPFYKIQGSSWKMHLHGTLSEPAHGYDVKLWLKGRLRDAGLDPKIEVFPKLSTRTSQVLLGNFIKWPLGTAFGYCPLGDELPSIRVLEEPIPVSEEPSNVPTSKIASKKATTTGVCSNVPTSKVVSKKVATTTGTLAPPLPDHGTLAPSGPVSPVPLSSYASSALMDPDADEDRLQAYERLSDMLGLYRGIQAVAMGMYSKDTSEADWYLIRSMLELGMDLETAMVVPYYSLARKWRSWGRGSKDKESFDSYVRLTRAKVLNKWDSLALRPVASLHLRPLTISEEVLSSPIWSVLGIRSMMLYSEMASLASWQEGAEWSESLLLPICEMVDRRYSPRLGNALTVKRNLSSLRASMVVALDSRPGATSNWRVLQGSLLGDRVPWARAWKSHRGGRRWVGTKGVNRFLSDVVGETLDEMMPDRD